MKPSFLKTSLTLVSIFLFIILPSILHAQVEEGRVYQYGDEDAIHIVTLKNGNILRGRILNFPYNAKPDTKLKILFYEEEIEFKFRDVVKIEVTGPEEGAAITSYYPVGADLEKFRVENLLISTTAIPMEKGFKEIRAQVPTAAALFSAEFGLGSGFSISTGFTVPGTILIFQGKYGAEVSNNVFLGGGITTGAALGIEEGWAGLIYGLTTFGSKKSFFNLQFGTTLFPYGGEAFFFAPGFSSKIGPRLRIGAEAFIFSDSGDTYLPYILPAIGWTFKNSNGGIDLGPGLVPDLLSDTGILFLPYGTLYFRFK